MSLTGPAFLDGIIALTVAAFVAVVVIWPHLTRRTPWHVAGRIGSLALVNVLVLLTAATQLNASFLFYTTWTDLVGSLSGHVPDQTTLHRGGDGRRAPSLHVAGARAAVAATVPPLDQAADSSGKLVYTVHGPLSGLTGTVVVVLPPGYTSPSDAAQRYPVLEAFHGYPSAPQGWLKNYPEPEVAQELADQHELRTPLLVIPQIEIPAGVDTEGVNGLRGEPQVETWLTRDVPDWVGAHFRVDADRDGWATIGDSAGGYVAAMATLLHPAQYGAGIVFGGYYRPDFGPYYEPFGSDSAQARRYDLVRAARAAPPVSLWVQTSHADQLSYSSSAAFLRAVHRPTSVHAVVQRDVGHRLSVWVALLPDALRWLGQNIRGFEPAPTSHTPALATHRTPSPRSTLNARGAGPRAAAPARSGRARQHRDGRRRRPGAR